MLVVDLQGGEEKTVTGTVMIPTKNAQGLTWENTLIRVK